LKPVTIPRLELAAATVSIKVARSLIAELDYDNMKSNFWIDSKVVLGYINNDVRRFHTYVANRVQLIRENSAPESWNYVETNNNPANDASRGINCLDIKADHRWFKGPSFLWHAEDQWSNSVPANVLTLLENDPEVRKQVVVCTTNVIQNNCIRENVIDRLLKQNSSWYRLKKNVAWILIAIDKLHSKVKSLPIRDMSAGLTVDELQLAEIKILKYIQRLEFASEIATLQLCSSGSRKTSIKKTSPICRLDPIIFVDGLLRVGGRLQRSSVNESQIHQIILPSKHPVTLLIVDYCHVLSGHSGKEFTLSTLRHKYWIIGARRTVRWVIQKCITCRKCFSRPCMQKMAALPVERVTSNEPPFTFVGVDFFGPFFVKIGRNDVKRYGCIFTCMTVRAVHIEVSHSLEADSFINALQRFICRRGQPLEIRFRQRHKLCWRRT
jgi:hypothetical protein